MKVAIIMPAYNEEQRIGKTLKQYIKYFTKNYSKEHEILVVLNGCKDNTVKVVKKYQVTYLDIKDLIGFVDADGSTSPQAFDDLIKNIKEYDGIIASRWMKGAQVSPKQTLVRRIASRTFNLLVRLFFRLGVHDTQCGAKLFKKEAAKKVIERLDITRWAFDVDLLYKAKKLGYKITEIPTVWADDPNSVLKVRRASVEMFLAITRLRLQYSPFRGLIALYDKLPEPLKIHKWLQR